MRRLSDFILHKDFSKMLNAHFMRLAGFFANEMRTISFCHFRLQFYTWNYFGFRVRNIVNQRFLSRLAQEIIDVAVFFHILLLSICLSLVIRAFTDINDSEVTAICSLTYRPRSCPFQIFMQVSVLCVIAVTKSRIQFKTIIFFTHRIVRT